MNNPTFTHVPVLHHELFITQWGDASNEALIMWHGLARTGRDFDELAQSLAEDYFVICPDTIGRGLSSWSDNANEEYAVPHYADIAIALLDHYGITTAKWLGTSMGGLIGMLIAAGPNAHRLSGLVLNDIGPEIPREAIERILCYADSDPEFNNLAEAEHWLRKNYAPFGPAPASFWRRMAYTSVRRKADGQFTTHYDPAIQSQFNGNAEIPHIWPVYESITMPVHVIRGENSDVLTKDTMQQMASRGPHAVAHTVTNCGHAPSLSRPEEINLVKSILTSW